MAKTMPNPTEADGVLTRLGPGSLAHGSWLSLREARRTSQRPSASPGHLRWGYKGYQRYRALPPACENRLVVGPGWKALVCFPLEVGTPPASSSLARRPRDRAVYQQDTARGTDCSSVVVRPRRAISEHQTFAPLPTPTPKSPLWVIIRPSSIQPPQTTSSPSWANSDVPMRP